MYSQVIRGDAVNGGSDASIYKEAFAVLQHKSRLELEKLMEDNDEFDSLVNGLAMVCWHFLTVNNHANLNVQKWFSLEINHI